MATETITSKVTKRGAESKSSQLHGVDNFLQGTGDLYNDSTISSVVFLYGTDFRKLSEYASVDIQSITLKMVARGYTNNNSSTTAQMAACYGFNLSGTDTSTYTFLNGVIVRGSQNGDVTVENTYTKGDGKDMTAYIIDSNNVDVLVNSYTQNTLGFRTYVKWAKIKSFTMSVTYLGYYTLSVSAGTGGTVTGSGTYESGTSTTVTATPNNGYKFKQWSDGNTSSTRTITMTGNTTLTAEFELNNKIYIGTSQPKAIYVGTQQVKSVYVGTSKVYG